jgi:hypothetical protein
MNEEKLEQEFNKKHEFQTSTRGVKIRGSFPTQEEAEFRCKMLREVDPAFDIYVGPVGQWLCWEPEAYKTGRTEYLEDELNKLVHEKTKNEANAKVAFDQRIKEAKEKAIKENIEKAEKSGNVLTQTLDENGELVGPEQILVADFDSSKANVNFAVGDIGPVEAAWRRSSEFPFAMQLALALAKPAKYFALLANTQNYTRNAVTAQFETAATGQHLTPTALLIQGYNNGTTTERNSGYLNWIRDYVKNLGIADASTMIKDNLAALDVQLAYKMAGYTDKRFIELLAEQSSPSSISDSVLVPEENYRIELYKGSPVNKITYSAVIVEKTSAGYAISGYDLTNPYFFIIPSQVNNNAYTITAGNQRGTVYKDFKKAKYTVPYGFEFNTKQQVVDFLVSYQRYLLAQGFIFIDRDSDLAEQKDWILSAKEFLHWSSQGWKPGSVIVLSPVSTTLKVFDSSSVVDEIVNTPYSSRVLDVNFKAIVKNNF